MTREDVQPQQRKPDQKRMNILRSLPLHIKESLTKEEVDAFLYGNEWPETLARKLEEYLVDV
jgi:hypothetical protein